MIYLFPKTGKPGMKKYHSFQSNYRPISLLPTLRKLYEVILSARLLGKIELNECQFGFLRNKSATDCIFLLIESILEARYISRERYGGRTQKLYTGCLDFKGAFDNVPRARIWKKMYYRFGVKGKLIRVIIDLSAILQP